MLRESAAKMSDYEKAYFDKNWVLVRVSSSKEEVSDRTWVSKCFLFGGVIFAFRKFLKW